VTKPLVKNPLRWSENVKLESIKYLGQENWFEFQNFCAMTYQPEAPRYLLIHDGKTNHQINVGDTVYRTKRGYLRFDPNASHQRL
jgi:hypothetical protein